MTPEKAKEVLMEQVKEWQEAKESRINACKEGHYDKAQLAIDCVRDNSYINALSFAIKAIEENTRLREDLEKIASLETCPEECECTKCYIIRLAKQALGGGE